MRGERAVARSFTWPVRSGIWVVPLVVFFLTRRVCRGLQAEDRIEELQEVVEAEVERGYAATPSSPRWPSAR